ncbi:hypothetical protein ABH930_005576 [Kitasatospora sp. GAS204A]|nr:hypothetical protein [Kitasatospora sp. GAS204B]
MSDQAAGPVEHFTGPAAYFVFFALASCLACCL